MNFFQDGAEDDSEFEDLFVRGQFPEDPVLESDLERCDRKIFALIQRFQVTACKLEQAGRFGEAGVLRDLCIPHAQAMRGFVNGLRQSCC